MAQAYIVGGVRTATGRKKGRLSKVHPVDLGAMVVDELVDRAGIAAERVDDLIFGVVSQVGAQAGNLGRNVAMSSKLPLEVPGVTVDRQCGSSLQAMQFAAQAVMSETQDVVIAGGVEAMSTVEIGSNVRDGLAHGRGVPKGERLEASYPGIRFSQFDGAELLAEKYDIPPRTTRRIRPAQPPARGPRHPGGLFRARSAARSHRARKWRGGQPCHR